MSTVFCVEASTALFIPSIYYHWECWRVHPLSLLFVYGHILDGSVKFLFEFLDTVCIPQLLSATTSSSVINYCRLVGFLRGHLVQLPVPFMFNFNVRPGFLGTCPPQLWKSPRMEILQHLKAICSCI